MTEYYWLFMIILLLSLIKLSTPQIQPPSTYTTNFCQVLRGLDNLSCPLRELGCISREELCNNIIVCPDGEDEGGQVGGLDCRFKLCNSIIL